MNNRTQQRFDRSIREALTVKLRVPARKTSRDDAPAPDARRPARPPQGRLYLDPETGATVWEPRR